MITHLKAGSTTDCGLAEPSQTTSDPHDVTCPDCDDSFQCAVCEKWVPSEYAYDYGIDECFACVEAAEEALSKYRIDEGWARAYRDAFGL